MELWQVILLCVGLSIPLSFVLMAVVDVWARHIVKKRHEKGRKEGKTDEEIAANYLLNRRWWEL